MKKIISLCLILALLMGLSASALAEKEGVAAAPNSLSESEGTQQDEAMKQVILAVKKTLDLNTDKYTEFDGDSRVRGKQTYWSLNWYNSNGSLSVETDEWGKIYSYYCFDYNRTYTSAKGLHFPDYCYDNAVEDADDFVKRVFDRDETVVWEETTDNLRSRNYYYLSGYMRLNDLPTEIYVDITLNTADGSIQSFSRSDGGRFIIGEVPSEIPSFDAKAAILKFAPTVTSRLQWIITDYETMEARMMYVFDRDYNVVLDAHTGKLVGGADYSAANSAKGDDAGAVETPEAETYDLTEVEIQGTEKFAGVLDGAALLAAVKAETAFGITDAYSIGNVRYTANQTSVDPVTTENDNVVDDGVTASYTLRYILTGPDFGLSQEEFDALLDEGYKPTVNKSFTADAHNGEIKSLYTYYSGFGWDEQKDEAEPVISKTAIDFLNTRYGDYMTRTELDSATRSSWGIPVDSFRYVRMHDGYALYDNSISVTVNAATGYVDSFCCYWDEAVSFGPSAPIVDEDAALSSYLNTYEAILGYSLLPEDSDDWESDYYWLLTYKLDSDNWCRQVDAITGEADVESYDYTENKISYNDLTDSYAAKEIEKLAKYGVGYYGVEQFLPTKKVTELDMVLFLLSADGYRYDYNVVLNMDEEELNWLYRSAVNEGFLSSAEQNPERLVSRSELCRSFVALADMNEAAQLKGIFNCGFTDEATIAEEDYGFVAIAKGLGIVSGDKSGTFRPNDGATRQELALMLYRYLSR